MQRLIKELVVGARDSSLSKKQVEEVYAELKQWHPHIVFKPLFVKTIGDLDQKTSLRTLGKTDFFTREIDRLLLEGKCNIGVHSAKDLPEPLPKGLVLATMTKGVDPRDALVLPENETLESLPKGAKIATSSLRREETVKKLRSDLTFVDIRGNIGQRYQKLRDREIDGVVIAEAALIRLNLTHLNRILLEGDTAPFQGRLAVIARESDTEILELFKPLYDEGNCCTNASKAD